MSELPPDNILERIKKCLNLAARAGTEAEAAAAMAAAQADLEKYNLTADVVLGTSTGSGAREKLAVEGGFYRYQQDLWQEVAGLNFCIYWHQQYRNWDGVKSKYGDVRRYLYRHQLVGKKVNVAATIAMATYLEGAATRLTKDRTQGLNSQYNLSNWANSYRRGIVSRVCRKLREKRNEALKAEEERAASAARSASNASTSTAVSLLVYVDKEYDANIDFIHGEGTAAKWASERAEEAARRLAERDAYTKWAAANPEAAAEEAAKRERQLDRKKTSASRKHYDGVDDSAYWAGYDDGDKISIDQQVDRPTRTERLTHG